MSMQNIGDSGSKAGFSGLLEKLRTEGKIDQPDKGGALSSTKLSTDKPVESGQASELFSRNDSATKPSDEPTQEDSFTVDSTNDPYAENNGADKSSTDYAGREKKEADAFSEMELKGRFVELFNHYNKISYEARKLEQEVIRIGEEENIPNDEIVKILRSDAMIGLRTPRPISRNIALDLAEKIEKPSEFKKKEAELEAKRNEVTQLGDETRSALESLLSAIDDTRAVEGIMFFITQTMVGADSPVDYNPYEDHIKQEWATMCIRKRTELIRQQAERYKETQGVSKDIPVLDPKGEILDQVEVNSPIPNLPEKSNQDQELLAQSLKDADTNKTINFSTKSTGNSIKEEQIDKEEGGAEEEILISPEAQASSEKDLKAPVLSEESPAESSGPPVEPGKFVELADAKPSGETILEETTSQTETNVSSPHSGDLTAEQIADLDKGAVDQKIVDNAAAQKKQPEPGKIKGLFTGIFSGIEKRGDNAQIVHQFEEQLQEGREELHKKIEKQ